MAQHLNPNDPASLAPGGSTENRPPQFVGGSIDPTSGNLIPGSRSDAANGRAAAVEQSIPEPAQPTTRLATIDAGPAPSSPKTDYGKIATDAAISAGIGAVSKGLSNTLSNGIFGGSGGGSGNPLDTPIGGGVNNTGAGSGSSGSAPLFEFPSPIPSSSYDTSTSAPSAPLSLSPSSSSSSSGNFFSDLFGGGGGSSSGAGQGATVICTELHRQGKLDGITFAADQRFGTMVRLYHPLVYAGYLAWARHVVTLMRASSRFTTFVKFFATPWAQYLAMRLGERKTAPLFGAVLFHIGWPVCGAIGLIEKAFTAGDRQYTPAIA